MAKKKRKKIRKFRTRMVLFVPICLSLIVILVVTIGKYWVDIVNKYQENERLSKELVTLKEKECSIMNVVAKVNK